MRVDLHCHSTFSDGADTPAGLLRAARAAGVDVIALTDHDTVGGHAEAIAALPHKLTLVLGAEISCQLDGIGLHLLAYLFDPAEPEFARERERIRADRIRRARAMVERCRQLGAPITWQQVVKATGAATSVALGRPHIALALVSAGVIPDIPSAFTEDWIGEGGRAYVNKYAVHPVRAISLIRAAGGVPVFAHPAARQRGRIVGEEAIATLAEAGLVGLEVDHPDHDPPTRVRLRALAKELGLLTTGGSDYHGSNKTVRLGEHTTDPDVYHALVARATGAQPVTGPHVGHGC